MDQETTTPTPRTALKRSSSMPVVLAVLVVAAGAGWWIWQERKAGAPPPPPPAAAPAAQADAAPPAVTADPAQVKSLLEAASPDATWRGWLGASDLVRRWAVAIDDAARGVSPRAQADFLAPKAQFSVLTHRGRSAISPRSYARYDGLADVVGKLDVSALAAAYRALHPALDTAYRAIAPPGTTLDQATARALERVRSAPVEEAQVPVVVRGGVYAFADARLEALPDLEKQLLRMGPRNERILQDKAKALEQALGLAVEPAAGQR